MPVILNQIWGIYWNRDSVAAKAKNKEKIEL